MTSLKLAHTIADLVLEKKAEDIQVLDLRGISNVTDFFVICSGTAEVHVKAILEHVKDQLQEQGVRPLHIEGDSYLKWALLDYIDVVVHIFLPETRDYYGLERFWGDAKIENIGKENGTD